MLQLTGAAVPRINFGVALLRQVTGWKPTCGTPPHSTTAGTPKYAGESWRGFRSDDYAKIGDVQEFMRKF